MNSPFHKRDDVLAVAGKYIEEHETEARERHIFKTESAAQASKKNNYTTFGDDNKY